MERFHARMHRGEKNRYRTGEDSANMRSSHEELMDRPVFFSLLAFSFMLLFLYTMYQILSPFFGPLLWALIIGIATYPVYLKILAKTEGKKLLSAAIMTVLAVVVIVL